MINAILICVLPFIEMCKKYCRFSLWLLFFLALIWAGIFVYATQSNVKSDIHVLSFQKWAGENVLSYPMTQWQIENLKPNKLVQWYTMQDSRVRISKQWLDKNAGPQVWSEKFLAEILVTASAAQLAKNKKRFDDPSIDWELYQVSWLDPDQPYISEILSKYDVQTVDQLGELVHNDGPTQFLDDALEWLRWRGTPMTISWVSI